VSAKALDASVEKKIYSMNETQVHRGPDGKKIWIGDNIAMGHTRLAINDLSEHGSQPISNEDGSLMLTCNGEVYNHRILRKELIEKGHKFKSRTDVEVILHLYEEHGTGCVEKIVGMFAFALWDKKSRKLLLARDRVGEKPLVYWRRGAQLYFASEIKAIRQAMDFEPEIDTNSFYHLITYPSVPHPYTMYKQIKKLPPASVMEWENGEIKISRYWHVSYANKRNISVRSAVDEYKDILRTCVSEMLDADVQVGVFLSGGVDSSSIAALAREIKGSGEVTTFTLGDDKDRVDPEFTRAVEVAKQYNLKHHKIKFTSDLISWLPEAIYYYDEPYWSYPAIYAQKMSKYVSAHVKVALAGNGADEVFGGYYGYNVNRLYSHIFRRSRLIPGWLGRFGGNGLLSKIAMLKKLAALPLYKRRGEFINIAASKIAANLFTDAYLANNIPVQSGELLDEYTGECDAEDYLDTVLYSDLMLYHMHGTTVLSDVSGMMYGLEIRSPFLDVRMIEFAASLPDKLKVPSLFNPRQNKYIMKKSMEGFLSDDILYGKKMGYGYNIRFGDLMKGPWWPVIKKYVLNGGYLEMGVFNKRAISQYVPMNPRVTWMLTCVSIFYEMNVKKRSVEDLTAEITASVAE